MLKRFVKRLLSCLLLAAVFVLAAAGIAVYGPTKRLQEMPVTAAINEL